jgi:hypothetical protein
MLRLCAAERAVQSKLVYRGYDLEVRRAPSGWQVGIYPRSADLPILSRSEIFAPDPDEAVVMAKGRVDRVIPSRVAFHQRIGRFARPELSNSRLMSLPIETCNNQF